MIGSYIFILLKNHYYLKESPDYKGISIRQKIFIYLIGGPAIWLLLIGGFIISNLYNYLLELVDWME